VSVTCARLQTTLPNTYFHLAMWPTPSFLTASTQIGPRLLAMSPGRSARPAAPTHPLSVSWGCEDALRDQT
jgi:hypothetical protein